jgi:hypothetical protein
MMAVLALMCLFLKFSYMGTRSTPRIKSLLKRVRFLSIATARSAEYDEGWRHADHRAGSLPR